MAACYNADCSMSRRVLFALALAAGGCTHETVRVVAGTSGAAARTVAYQPRTTIVVVVEPSGGPPPAEAVGSGDRNDGAPCADSRECSPGLGCHGVGKSGRCRPFCGGASRATCPPGTRCVGGGDGLGLCVP
jgi:hypothetical protein